MGISGEWWIDDSGSETFADGDAGDQNHEYVAFWSALGVDEDEIRFNAADYILRELSDIMPEIERKDPERFEELSDLSDREIADELAGELEEVDAGSGIPSVAAAAALVHAFEADSGAVDFFMGSGGDARFYMMSARNWIRVARNIFQLDRFDDDALARIRDFILEQYPEDENPLEDEFEIEELREGGWHLTLTGEDILESGKTAAQLLFSGRRERPGFYNPVA